MNHAAFGRQTDSNIPDEAAEIRAELGGQNFPVPRESRARSQNALPALSLEQLNLETTTGPTWELSRECGPPRPSARILQGSLTQNTVE